MKRRTFRIAAFAVVFGSGYLVGTITHPSADAQVNELGKKAMEQAAGAGGPLGAAAQLGDTITGLQKNVSELQSHIDTLNKIKSALGG
jgi:hypothetical protein